MVKTPIQGAKSKDEIGAKAAKSSPDGVEFPKDGYLLQAILRSIQEGMIFADSDGLVVELNERAEKLLGEKREKVLGKSIFDLHPPQIRQRVHSLLEEIESNPDKDLRILEHWQGDRWIEIRFSALKDQFGKLQGIIVNYREQTESKRLEEQWRSLEHKLQQEHRLSEIGVLASGIAHNLNGPLSVIVGYLDLLYCRYPELEDIPMILSQAERMKEIISNMMIKSRHEQDSRRRPINLNSLLQNELKFLEANLEFKHRINKLYDFAQGLPDIYGVYSDFSQCFLNIVNNAIDAMVDSPVKELSVRTRYDRENISIEFQDTGCGLDPKEADKIFNPFYTTKPPVGEGEPGRPTGTGLGLSSVYQLIKKYRGSILVDGAPGKGAKFTVVIPIEVNLPPRDKSDSESSVEETHASEVEA